MRTASAAAPARVALAGNPSDAYGGRVLSLAIANHRARVRAHESERLEIVPAAEDHRRFDDVGELVRDVRANGYYGGVRLVKAAIKRLAAEVEIGALRFTIEYETDIPRAVGLGGSSAIVIATMRAVLELAGEAIGPARLAELALAAETEELGITAGLQDRVAQAHGGLTYMDFAADPDAGERYERLDPGLLPPLFVAHLPAAGEPSELPHSDLRRRWETGDRSVVAAMSELGELAAAARGALFDGDRVAFASAMDATFDARRRIVPLDPRHVELIERARAAGCAANFTGSGGAIVGAYAEAGDLGELERELEGCGARVAACEPAAQLVYK